MQDYLISRGCLHFNKTDVSFASLGLLIVPEENGSVYLNPVEIFLKYLSGQYYPLSKQEGISPLLILEGVFSVLLYVFFLCLMKKIVHKQTSPVYFIFFFTLN